MNKIATYLNEHLSGEVFTHAKNLDDLSADGSVLGNRPEMVAKVANVNDIRKIMRFCSQLAEKGHVLPVTVRGDGTDTTGSATTSGLVIDVSSRLNHVIGLDPRQKLIHIQSGMRYSAVNAILSTHRGLGLANISEFGLDGTLGGAIGSGADGSRVGVRLSPMDSIKQVEVVLSNGDILQTDRLSKRDLARKKGLTTLEGEIYRKVDNLITDNKETIAKLKKMNLGTTGYSNITKVKAKDGSFNLAPLFVGSQGTLGIISEVILQAGFIKPDLTVVISAYENMTDAQSAIDLTVGSKASAVNLIDGRVFAEAAKQGKKVSWAPEPTHSGAVVMAIFDDFSERTRARLAKSIQKKLKSTNPQHTEVKKIDTASLSELYSAIAVASRPSNTGEEVPGVFSGMWLPVAQLDIFINELRQLEEMFGVAIPIFYDATTEYLDLFPVFDLKKVSNRQNLLKILAELANMIDRLGGSLAGRGGDGKLKSFANTKVLDKDILDLFQQIRVIFDPHSILNTGVKQEVPVKELVAQINYHCRA